MNKNCRTFPLFINAFILTNICKTKLVFNINGNYTANYLNRHYAQHNYDRREQKKISQAWIFSSRSSKVDGEKLHCQFQYKLPTFANTVLWENSHAPSKNKEEKSLAITISFSGRTWRQIKRWWDRRCSRDRIFNVKETYSDPSNKMNLPVEILLSI